jgi:hypothetical protein
MVPVTNSRAAQVLSFVRADENHAVLALFNFSAQPQQFRLQDGPFAGSWQEAFGEASLELTTETDISLPAWGWRVLVR